MVQWLKGAGSIPGWGTNILHAAWHSQKKKRHSLNNFQICDAVSLTVGFLRWLSRKNPLHVGEVGSIPGSGRSPIRGDGSPFQYSCLKNPTDRVAWWAAIHEVAKSNAQLNTRASLPVINMLSVMLPGRSFYNRKSVPLAQLLCSHRATPCTPSNPRHVLCFYELNLF